MLSLYSNFQSRYHKGISNLDGESTWYTFKNGVNVTFTDVTEPWVNTFINTGFASAYGSFLIKKIGETKWFSTTNMHELYGGKEFMEKYKRSTNCPGLAMYIQTESCYDFWDGVEGEKLNDTAMKMIVFDNESPYSDHDSLVDVVDRTIKTETKHLYWWQKDQTWYSSSNKLMDSAFFKIEPYNGVLDTGLAIYNGCDEIDRHKEKMFQLQTRCEDWLLRLIANILL